MPMPIIKDVEEFKRHICMWCTNLECDQNSLWEQRADTKQIICLDFQSDYRFKGNSETHEDSVSRK